MRDITLGQYFPGNSPIHRLDPRTKLLGMLAYIIVIFFVKKITVFLLPALFVAMVTYLARVPLSYLVRSLKPIRFLLVFMFFINLFMVKTGDLIWECWYHCSSAHSAGRTNLRWPWKAAVTMAERGAHGCMCCALRRVTRRRLRHLRR